jgi:hypothetical protein
MCNNKINLVIYRGILCGLIGLSSMMFGMNEIVEQKPIAIGETTLQLLTKDNRNLSKPYWLNNNKDKDPLNPTMHTPILRHNDIEAVLVKIGPDNYHMLTSALLEGNTQTIPYKGAYFQIPLTGFKDRSFNTLEGLASKGSIELFIPDQKSGNDRYVVKSVKDNSKKGIFFYCGLGVSAFVFIGAILFYLGKLPQF